MARYQRISQQAFSQYRSQKDESFALESAIRNCAIRAQQIFKSNQDNPSDSQTELEEILEDLKELRRIESQHPLKPNTAHAYINQVQLLLHYIDFTIEVKTANQEHWEQKISEITRISNRIKEEINSIFSMNPLTFEETVFNKMLYNIEKYETAATRCVKDISELQLRAAEFIADKGLSDNINLLPPTPLKKAIKFELSSLKYSTDIRLLLQPRIILLKKWHEQNLIISETEEKIKVIIDTPIKSFPQLREREESLKKLIEIQHANVDARNILLMDAKVLKERDNDVQNKFGSPLFSLENIFQEKIKIYKIEDSSVLKKNFLQNIQKKIQKRIALVNSCHINDSKTDEKIRILKKAKSDLEILKVLEETLFKLMSEAGLNDFNSILPGKFLEMTTKKIKILENLGEIETVLNKSRPIHHKILKGFAKIIDNTSILKFISDKLEEFRKEIIKIIYIPFNIIIYPWLELSKSISNIKNGFNVLSNYGRLILISLSIIVPALLLTTFFPFGTISLVSLAITLNFTAGFGALFSNQLFNSTPYIRSDAPLAVKKILGVDRANELWRLLLTKQKQLQTKDSLSVEGKNIIEKLRDIQHSLENITNNNFDKVVDLEKSVMRMHYQQVKPMLNEANALCESSEKDKNKIEENLLKKLDEVEQQTNLIRNHVRPISFS